MGKLEPVFAGVARVLAPTGCFIFSVESAGGDGHVLRPSGRYAHSEQYVERVAAAHDFVVAHHAPSVIRLEDGQPIDGYVFLLQRTAQ